jgi:prevent-host-death family protein
MDRNVTWPKMTEVMGLMSGEFMTWWSLDVLKTRRNIMEVSVSELKAHFSRLLRLVEKEHEITITRRGIPVARLLVRKTKRRRPGA